MGFGIQERKLLVVECKRCRRNVAAGIIAYCTDARSLWRGNGFRLLRGKPERVIHVCIEFLHFVGKRQYGLRIIEQRGIVPRERCLNDVLMKIVDQSGSNEMLQEARKDRDIAGRLNATRDKQHAR